MPPTFDPFVVLPVFNGLLKNCALRLGTAFPPPFNYRSRHGVTATPAVARSAVALAEAAMLVFQQPC